jgi:hypothetical protein
VEAAGGHVHAARENLDTSTPNGRFTRDIHLAVAVNEREEHAERFAKRRKATCEAGVWRQHQTPRGYVFAGPAGADGRYRGLARKLVPGPEAEDVRRAAHDVLAGVPITKIARRLGMTPSGARQMLRNRVYLGELRDGPTINPNAHDPILTLDIFDAVGVALAGNPRPARRVAAGPALLAKIAICQGCGKSLTRKSTTRMIYACPVHHSGGDCPAPASITCHLLDDYVETYAQERYAAGGVEFRGDDRAGDVDAAETKLAEARHTRKALLRVILDSGMAAADAADEVREANERVAVAERELREAHARSHEPQLIPGSKAYEDEDVAGRNRALRGMVAGVVVTRSGRGGRPDVASRARVVFVDD